LSLPELIVLSAIEQQEQKFQNDLVLQLVQSHEHKAELLIYGRFHQEIVFA
jgi:hypothetical protein